MEVNKIYNGNNLEVLKDFEDDCVDALISDFPYGLQDINALKLIKENSNNTKGFMGKDWDCLPSVEMLREFYRVLKVGGWLITTFTPRQDLQCVLQYRLLEAGFDISFSSTYWAYASGFPKACNYGKLVDKALNCEREKIKRNPNSGENCDKSNTIYESGTVGKTDYITEPASEEAKYINGLYSNSLKPAVEIIIVAQKPFKGAKFQQALKWYNERKELLNQGIKEQDLSLYTKNASGGVRVDDCKMATEEIIEKGGTTKGNRGIFSHISRNKEEEKRYHNEGRFPANLLVSDNAVDVGRNWKSSDNMRNNNQSITSANANYYGVYRVGVADEGDFSRYFSLDNWTKKHYPELYKLSEKCLTLEEDVSKIYPFINANKPSVAEKNAGLEEFEITQNTHPTSKPISLFAYLISLYSSENDIILDPFCGSGTTCIASILTNRKFIGIDITKEYCNIANARVEYWKKAKDIKNNNTLL